MNQSLRNLGRLLVVLLVLGVLVATTIYAGSYFKLHRHYVVVVPAAPVPTDSGAVERGRHIALTRGCLHCHGEDLGGGKVVDNFLIGKITAPNITLGRGGLPAGFRNEDWVRAIRHGVGPDERALIIMPAAEFAHLSDDDFGSLLAFLASMPKVDRDTIPVRLGPLGRALLVTGKLPLAADLINHDTAQAHNVVPGITVEYGRYLAANCTGCHGVNFSGGKIPGAPPEWPASSNLTPLSSEPLIHWTGADFITTLRMHRRPNGTDLNEAMPRTFGQLTDAELQAIWIYLRTLPPAANGERPPQSPPNPTS